MGRVWNGRCYQDDASALAAFARDLTTGNAVGITTFTAAPTINGSGLVSWSISHRPLTGTAATTRTGTTQLLPCSDGTMNQWPVETVLTVLAIFFAAVLGFRSGFRP